MPTMASAQGVGNTLIAVGDAISTVASTSSNQAASPASMHPLLFAAACNGSLKALSYLLNREETLAQPNMMPPQAFLDLLAAYASDCCSSGSLLVFHRAAASDLEGGASPAYLLGGVTMEGDTALHVVAANGDDDIFLSCADLIHGKDRTFLSKQNSKGDTALHCAARAGHAQMVSHLVALARSDSILEDLLRKENSRKETVLHEAVRIGDNKIVKDLLEADPELACFPMEGSSPLYLAISLKEETIVETLHEDSKDKVLSYLGPNGQNALHVAVLRGPVLTRRLLEWNKDLATKADENGSTALHFAAAQHSEARPGSEIVQLLEANTAALYQPDHQGLFPIHVAASVGETKIIALFVTRFHSSSHLRDAKGRTFLHVAVDNHKRRVVAYACQNASLACILNMQDSDGNTALHLAVKAMQCRMVCKLLGRREVKINLTNAEGQTPLDTAEYMVPPGWSGIRNSIRDIHYLLQLTGATRGVVRRDHFKESCGNINGSAEEDCEIRLAKILSESSQSLLIGSVLVATVTFGAAFAMPGGYRQDDHPNGGTPTLAWSGAFNAFLAADIIAFLCSSLATVGFMLSGDSTIGLRARVLSFSVSRIVMLVSTVAMVAAFGLGVQAVLLPFSKPFGTQWLAYFVFFSGMYVTYLGLLLRLRISSVKAIWTRKGPTFLLMRVAGLFLLTVCLVLSLCIYLLTLTVKAHASTSESPAQPPAPLP